MFFIKFPFYSNFESTTATKIQINLKIKFKNFTKFK